MEFPPPQAATIVKARQAMQASDRYDAVRFGCLVMSSTESKRRAPNCIVPFTRFVWRDDNAEFEIRDTVKAIELLPPDPGVATLGVNEH